MFANPKIQNEKMTPGQEAQQKRKHDSDPKHTAAHKGFLGSANVSPEFKMSEVF